MDELMGCFIILGAMFGIPLAMEAMSGLARMLRTRRLRLERRAYVQSILNAEWTRFVEHH